MLTIHNTQDTLHTVQYRLVLSLHMVTAATAQMPVRRRRRRRKTTFWPGPGLLARERAGSRYFTL